MKRIDNLIFIILIFGIFICVFFWYQLSEYKLSEITLQKSKTPNNEPILPMSIPSEPVVELTISRNIFKSPHFSPPRIKSNIQKPVSKEVVEKTTLEEKPKLSTIFWSQENPIAIINGEILTEGEEDSEFQFKVETITPDKVGIRFLDDREFVWLKIETE